MHTPRSMLGGLAGASDDRALVAELLAAVDLRHKLDRVVAGIRDTKFPPLSSDGHSYPAQHIALAPVFPLLQDGQLRRGGIPFSKYVAGLRK